MEIFPAEYQIRVRAYRFYHERGRLDGHDIDDWLQAEHELREARHRELWFPYQTTEWNCLPTAYHYLSGNWVEMSKSDVADDQKTLDAFHKNGVTAVKFICREQFSNQHTIAIPLSDQEFFSEVVAFASIVTIELQAGFHGHAIALIGNIQIDPSWPRVVTKSHPAHELITTDGRISLIGNKKQIVAAYLFSEIDRGHRCDRLFQNSTTQEPPMPPWLDALRLQALK